MPSRIAFTSHAQYIEAQQPEVQPMLRRIQAEVESRVADATRCISYNMPAYRSGKTFFYFAAFKQHIGIYPPVTTDRVLLEALLPYRGAKGNLSFALDKPMPYDLIGRVADALARQYGTADK